MLTVCKQNRAQRGWFGLPGSRCTAAESDRRATQVAGMLAEGKSRAEIVRECEGLLGLSDAQVDRYMAKGRSELAKSLTGSLEGRIAVSEARFERLWGMAIEAEDVGAAMAVLKAEWQALGRARESVLATTEHGDELANLIMTGLGCLVDEKVEEKACGNEHGKADKSKKRIWEYREDKVG